MDAYAVQQHVSDWFNSGGITGLDKCWAAQPNAIGFNFADFGSGTMRCQAAVYVEDDTEVRRSTPVRHGMKWVTYAVRVEFCHRSAEDDWTAADRALKQDVVMGAVQMIRNDPALGAGNLPDPLFIDAGEGRAGMRRQYEPPFTDEASGEREQWAYLVFTVSAWVVA